MLSTYGRLLRLPPADLPSVAPRVVEHASEAAGDLRHRVDVIYDDIATLSGYLGTNHAVDLLERSLKLRERARGLTPAATPPELDPPAPDYDWMSDDTRAARVVEDVVSEARSAVATIDGAIGGSFELLITRQKVLQQEGGMPTLDLDCGISSATCTAPSRGSRLWPSAGCRRGLRARRR